MVDMNGILQEQAYVKQMYYRKTKILLGINKCSKIEKYNYRKLPRNGF